MKAANYVNTNDTVITATQINGSQTVNYKSIINAFNAYLNRNEKMKVVINIDDHKPQSKLEVSVWIPTQGWVPVYNLPIQASELKNISGYTKWSEMQPSTRQMIMITADEMLQVAKQIIF
jgi:hypothetical protein